MWNDGRFFTNDGVLFAFPGMPPDMLCDLKLPVYSPEEKTSSRSERIVLGPILIGDSEWLAGMFFIDDRLLMFDLSYYDEKRFSELMGLSSVPVPRPENREECRLLDQECRKFSEESLHQQTGARGSLQTFDWGRIAAICDEQSFVPLIRVVYVYEDGGVAHL